MPRLTPEHRQRLEEIAARYRRAAEAGHRSPVRALPRELGRPEPTVRSWVRRCQELGLLSGNQAAERQKMRRGLSPKSVWNVHICLRAALNDAIEDGLLKTNPAKGAMKEPKGGKETKTWTAEELRAFHSVIKDDRNLPLYRLAAYSGMRRGELLGLRWQDVKFHLGSLSVQQQLGFVDDEEDEFLEEDSSPVFVPVKTEAGRRSIRLDRITLTVLHAHRAAQASKRQRLGSGYQDHDLVFCRADGAPYDPDTISGQFERLVRRSRLPRIRFHDLRHTHATLLLEAHVDITVVSRRLGHANVQITADRYAHVTARLQYDAAERFSSLVDGAPVSPPMPPAIPDHVDPAGGRHQRLDEPRRGFILSIVRPVARAHGGDVQA